MKKFPRAFCLAFAMAVCTFLGATDFSWLKMAFGLAGTLAAVGSAFLYSEAGRQSLEEELAREIDLTAYSKKTSSIFKAEVGFVIIEGDLVSVFLFKKTTQSIFSAKGPNSYLEVTRKFLEMRREK